MASMWARRIVPLLAILVGVTAPLLGFNSRLFAYLAVMALVVVLVVGAVIETELRARHGGRLR